MDSAVSAWLEDLGLRRYVAVFAENEIGLEALRLLNEQDLREFGLLLGPRKLYVPHIDNSHFHTETRCLVKPMKYRLLVE